MVFGNGDPSVAQRCWLGVVAASISAAAVAGCGGSGSPKLLDPPTSSPSTSTAAPDTGTSTSVPGTTIPSTTLPAITSTTHVTIQVTTTRTALKVRARFPGPPGSISPTGEGSIAAKVGNWYGLLSQRPGKCQSLLTDVLSSVQPSNPPDPTFSDPVNTYRTLYRGAAEGCLGKLTAASNDLAKAADLLRQLDPTGQSTDSTCQPQRLLVWANDAYLNRTIPLVCPAPPPPQ